MWWGKVQVTFIPTTAYVTSVTSAAKVTSNVVQQGVNGREHPVVDSGAGAKKRQRGGRQGLNPLAGKTNPCGLGRGVCWDLAQMREAHLAFAAPNNNIPWQDDAWPRHLVPSASTGEIR